MADLKKNIDIHDLTLLISGGDIVAFETFYKLYFAEIWSFAAHYVLSKEIARDIVQDSFVHIFNNRKSIDPKQTLKGYLYTIVKNRCLNHLRSYKIADSNKAGLIEAIVFSNTSEYDDELMERVESCKRQLSEQQQRIITMKIEGRSYLEIAEVLGIKVSTVSVHIKRTYKFIRDNTLIINMIFFLFKNN